MTNAVEIRTCAHRKTNGIPCGSPALKGQPFCYFHHRFREQAVYYSNSVPLNTHLEMDLPVLEDANAIQMCLTKVFHMLAVGLMDPFLARPLIKCLQLAIMNLRNTNFAPKPEELGANAEARPDQSLTYTSLDTDRLKDWESLQSDKESAAATEQPVQDAQPAEAAQPEVSADENNRDHVAVDIKAVAVCPRLPLPPQRLRYSPPKAHRDRKGKLRRRSDNLFDRYLWRRETFQEFMRKQEAADQRDKWSYR